MNMELTEHEKHLMQNNQLPTKTPIELKEYSIDGNIGFDVGQVAISVLRYLAVLQVDNLV